MRHLKEVLRLHHELKLSVRQLARATGLARSTVADYLRRATEAALSWPLPEELDEPQLWAKLFEAPVPEDPEPESTAATSRALPDWAVVHRELRRKNITLVRLWREYREIHPGGYGRSQFFQLYRQWTRRLDPVLRLTHEPGDKLFVDWAGAKVGIRDPNTGDTAFASVFVAALGFSHQIYAEAFADEKLGSWIAAHVHALGFYGGVPRLIVPDNPKTGVVTYCPYEPKLHPTYREMAAHYGTAILPARPRKPRDKASVETAVQIVQREILGALRDHTFFSLGALNQEIGGLLATINARPFTQKEGCRQQLFETEERPVLAPLPDQPYQPAHWRRARVNIDYHIVVDKHFYSVPYDLVNRSVEVRLSETIVEVHYQGKRMAVHPRSNRQGGFTTLAEHRPKAHERHLEWTPGRLIQWGRQVGPCCGQVVSHILESRPHPEQGYRSCLGLFRLSKDVGPERMEAACGQALRLQACSYASVKNILKAKLDQLSESQQAVLIVPEHENLRGAQYYEQSLQSHP